MLLSDQIFVLTMVFFRVAACFMIVPGVSSARVPVRVRLYLAVALALIVASIIDIDSVPVVKDGPALLAAISGETLAGAAIGFTTRILIEAIQFAGTAISQYIGLSSMMAGVDSVEPEPTLSSLISITAVLLLLLLDLPAHVMVSLVNSFADLPIGSFPKLNVLLERLSSLLAVGYMFGLQLAAPFLIYAIVVNALFGILGKLIPQIQSYFLSGPFLVLGGLLLLYLAIGEMLSLFTISVHGELQKY